MAAQTENKIVEISVPGLLNMVVASGKTLYAGSLCFIDASTGLATDITNSGANKLAGLVVDGASAGERVEIRTNVELVVDSTGLAADDMGKALYAINNNDTTLTSTSNTKIGTLVKYISATSCRVRLNIEA